MTSGAVTTRECVLELGTRSAGWCECGLLIDRSLLRAQEYPRCPDCQCEWAVEGILKLGDPRVLAILTAVEGARTRLERKRSTVAAIEGHFERSGGRSLIS